MCTLAVTRAGGWQLSRSQTCLPRLLHVLSQFLGSLLHLLACLFRSILIATVIALIVGFAFAANWYRGAEAERVEAARRAALAAMTPAERAAPALRRRAAIEAGGAPEEVAGGAGTQNRRPSNIPTAVVTPKRPLGVTTALEFSEVAAIL